jgi:hypothetical protein
MVKRNNKASRRKRGASILHDQVERPLREKKEMIFRTQCQGYNQNVDISAAAAITGGLYFTISQVANATALLSVFDQYRIKRVCVTFIPQNVTSFIAAASPTTLVPTAVYNPGILLTCVDQDDATNPASDTTILQHESCIVHGPLMRAHSRTFVPAVAASVYQTGGFGGYSTKENQWLDSASLNVQHYGLKYAVSHGLPGPAGTATMAIYYNFDVEFRKVY